MIRKGKDSSDVFLLPNGVNTETFKPITKDESLLSEIGIQGKKVFMYAHPRTKHKLADYGLNLGDVPNLKVIDPVGYLDMLTLEANAKKIVTDSGGVQKEAYFMTDTSYVESSSKEIAKYAHEGMLVVLESTTYPGTTEEIVKPALEEKGLKTGETVFVAYSPERVDPGNKQFKTKNTPKVVGGITENCTKVAAALYRSVLEGDVHEVSSPAVAEMEKIFENTFRHINIALANEMAILCEKMGIDVWEVIDAAKTKPYGFMAFCPGPGLIRLQYLICWQ